MSENSGPFRSARNYVTGRWLLPVESFIRTEQLGSILLLAATAAALAWVNSPWHESYFHFWETEIGIDLGLFSIEEHLGEWVNDGLVAIFFFVMGMEEIEFLPLPACVWASATPAVTLYVRLYTKERHKKRSETSWWCNSHQRHRYSPGPRAP